MYIAFHKRNRTPLDDVENWPVSKIMNVYEYLKSLDDAEYQQYLKQKEEAK